jgi:uncharacterized protein (DUF1810 family)
MADTSDPFDLGRFVAAQADVYAQALSEIKRGTKVQPLDLVYFSSNRWTGYKHNFPVLQPKER